jgi:Lactate racemase N-terminal domain
MDLIRHSSFVTLNVSVVKEGVGCQVMGVGCSLTPDPYFRRRIKMSQAFPKMATITQTLYSAALSEAEIIATVQREFAKVGLQNVLKAGQSVAIGAGSRGIANIALIVKAIADEVKKSGAHPFVFPAMGSHGGGTAEGQVEMLGTLGVTAEYLGCPIKSSMETVILGNSPSGLPVHLDKYASEADAIIAVNRIKEHTNFRGEVESGLMKMLSIGMGKHNQAMAIHAYGVNGLRDYIPEVGRALLERAKIVAGFGIVEDAYHQTAKVVGVAPADIMRVEADLLKEMKATAARLPVSDIDVLIVNEIGKNISGAGMDTNVIGRMRLPEAEEPTDPRIKWILALDLTEETHGNACGIGLADLTTRRLFNKIDFQRTYINVLTGMGPMQGMIPLVFENDKECLEQIFKYLLGPIDPLEARVVRIQNTLEINQVQVSAAILKELEGKEGITVDVPLAPIEFSNEGNLV